MEKSTIIGLCFLIFVNNAFAMKQNVTVTENISGIPSGYTYKGNHYAFESYFYSSDFFDKWDSHCTWNTNNDSETTDNNYKYGPKDLKFGFITMYEADLPSHIHFLDNCQMTCNAHSSRCETPNYFHTSASNLALVINITYTGDTDSIPNFDVSCNYSGLT